jgi:hypothetical protein
MLALIMAACVYDVIVVVIQRKIERSISRFLWRGLRVPAVAVAIGVILGHCGLLLGPEPEEKDKTGRK